MSHQEVQRMLGGSQKDADEVGMCVLYAQWLVVFVCVCRISSSLGCSNF
jgi:hypothetical protein